MDRSFIISGVSNQGGSARPVAAVLFSNSAPAMDALLRLGFIDIQSVEEVKPLSKQPTEPTLYLYTRSPPPIGVEVTRLDWSHNAVSQARAGGDPSFLIPPVGGPAADRLLYVPKAFVVSANVKEQGRSKPVVAVLFIKPKAGEGALAPDKKTLNGFGLVDLQTVERVETSGRIPESVLYIFERSPAASCVSVATVRPDCSLMPAELVQGEPHAIIPPITGSAADRFVNPRNAPGISDFPRGAEGRRSEPPPSSKARRGRRS